MWSAWIEGAGCKEEVIIAQPFCQSVYLACAPIESIPFQSFQLGRTEFGERLRTRIIADTLTSPYRWQVQQKSPPISEVQHTRRSPDFHQWLSLHLFR